MRAIPVLMLFLLTSAQAVEPYVFPLEGKPLRVPATPLLPDEEARREALTRFGLGFLRSRDERLVEATKQYRAAAECDPIHSKSAEACVGLRTPAGRLSK